MRVVLISAAGMLSLAFGMTALIVVALGQLRPEYDPVRATAFGATLCVLGLMARTWVAER